jgi:hypothetical protein
MVFRLGLDWHGVISADPAFFTRISKEILAHGGEVHIITGKSWSEENVQQLLSYNGGDKWWTHYFSVDDYLLCEKALDFTFDKKGGRWFEDMAWNRAKADYCENHHINLHIDDCPDYLAYFSTPTYYYQRKATNTEELYETIIQLLRIL